MPQTAVNNYTSQSVATMQAQQKIGNKDSGKSVKEDKSSTKEPTTSLPKIMALVDMIESKLTMLSAHEGTVAETVNDSNVKLAVKYKSEIDSFNAKSKGFNKFLIASSVFQGAAAATGGALGAARPTVGQLGETIQTFTNATANLGQAGTQAGMAVMEKKKADTESDEDLTSGTMSLTKNESDTLIGDAENTMNTAQSGKSAEKSMLSNENQASEYRG